LVGFESRSTMLPTSLAACVPCSWRLQRRPAQEREHR
jgi:hypothetical protein